MQSQQELDVYLYGRLVGYLHEDDRHALKFRYCENWYKSCQRNESHLLSISLPLPKSLDDFCDMKASDAFFAGLLPDSTDHRQKLAKELGLADCTHFSLLSEIGRDCAGAIVIVPHDRQGVNDAPSLRELGDDELEAFIKDLPRRPLMVDDEEGVRLSLAGVNDKAAIVYMDNKTYIPRNGYISSHIIKPDISSLDGSIRVEHFCLKLASSVGIKVPRSSIQKVNDIVYMRMARYDRKLITKHDGQQILARRHQEDFCQALGLDPIQKYEKRKGSLHGPSWKDCFALMDRTLNPEQSKSELLNRCIFQYLCGNPDAHGKNYSLLYDENGGITLSPLYDLNNASSYRDKFKDAKPLMAMSIGGEFYSTSITLDHWIAFAEECNLDTDEVLNKLEDMASKMQQTLPPLVQSLNALEHHDRILLAEQDILERCVKVTHQCTMRKNPSFRA